MRDILVPSFHAGQRVVWENHSVHRNAEVRQLIEAVGGTLHPLPTSSLDLKPLELAFSKLKTLLRQTGARTRAGPDDAITTTLAQVTAANAAAWIATCGYGQAHQP